MTKIIAICGLMRSGKDTIADYISKRNGYTKVHIADTLKKTMHVMFGFTHEQLEGNNKDIIDPNWGISPRSAMQFFGTEIMQYKIQELLPDIGRTFWIASLVSSLKKNPENSYIISDLRFIHEYNYLKENYKSVYIIKVTNPNTKTSYYHSHNSEQEFKRIPEDIHISNDSDLADLYKKIDEILSQIE